MNTNLNRQAISKTKALLFSGILFLMLVTPMHLFAQKLEHDNLQFPLRGIFYYAWYPNTWKPNGYHVQYNPTIGYYTSTDMPTIRHHITELDYANIDVAIASWWGLDNDNRIPRDTAIDRCMTETDGRNANGESDLKWAIYYELEASYNEPMDTVKADLEYLMERYVKRHSCYAHINGKPVIFVYTRGSEDNTVEFMKKWADAVDDKWFYVLKVFGGYKDMPYQPSSWHQYGPSTRMHKHEDSSRKLVCINISPGFKHADPNKDAFLERATQQEWTDLVKEMVDSKVDWQLITSYNEWGEGTAIESAAEWQTESGYGMYQDVLHNFPTKEKTQTTIRKNILQNEELPYSILKNTLRMNKQPNRVSVYSLTGRLILQEKNISTKVLECKERFTILHIEVGENIYRLKHVSF